MTHTYKSLKCYAFAWREGLTPIVSHSIKSCKEEAERINGMRWRMISALGGRIVKCHLTCDDS